MRTVSKYITVVVVLLCAACNKNLDTALQLAGSNRAELEKVLSHFKDDPDGLKYRSAKFLIENMPYNYSNVGDAAEYADSAFRVSSCYPIEQRDSVFKQIAYSNPSSSAVAAIDLKSLKADYLIEMINEACDVWHQVNWKGEYDESIFFDYVLPYRLMNEPVSAWRTYVKENYPFLYTSTVSSNRGIDIECENGVFNPKNLQANEAASGKQMVWLKEAHDSLTLTLPSHGTATKRLFFKYSVQTLHAKAAIYLNGRLVSTLALEPTNYRTIFRENRVGLDVTLSHGDNQLTVVCMDEPFGMDYVRVSSLETIDVPSLSDYSQRYCTIRNKQTGHYLTFDLGGKAKERQLQLKEQSANDTTQLLRLDYLGFSIWKICSAHNDTTDLCMEVGNAALSAGSAVVQNDYITTYQKVKINHQKWVIIPLGNGYCKIMNKDSGLFLTAVRRGQKEILTVDTYQHSDAQHWLIEEQGKRRGGKSIYAFGGAVSEAMKVYDVNILFEWYDNKSGLMPRGNTLLRGLSGNCREEGSFAVYLCRSLGIPSAIDFTPNWGNRSQGHTWNVIINPDGKSTPFFMGSVPGDTAHYSYSYSKAKVFRRRFSLNRDMAEAFAHEKYVPSLFRSLNIIDVTDEYYDNPVDVERPVPEAYSDKKVAYICVFDNANWVPVYYGRIKNGKVMFRCMGPDIVYMAAICDERGMHPFGNPFLVAGDGTVTDISVRKDQTVTMHLTRKFPFLGKFSDINYKMGGGLFQGSNDANFTQVTNFYRFEGVTNGNWYDIPIDDTKEYQYLRYLGPEGSHGNINELAFFDKNGNKLTGRIIGTQGEPKKTKETVFDGDILTGFQALGADGQWVGLQLSRPSTVGRIRFIARNDGNTIEKGDLYALCYWDNCQWNEVERMVATGDHLTIHHVPAGGLYILHDLTKGKEERLFTYENGEQIWW